MKIKHKEKLNRGLLKYLYFSAFLLGIASAFILYLESDYFKKSIGSENLTLFFISSYLLALILILNWHHVVRIWGKSNVFLFSLAVKICLALSLAVLPLSAWSAWLLVIYITFTVLNWLDLDLLLECCSVDKKTGKIRGIYLTIENAGYLLAPLAAGYLVSRFGFQAAFLASAFILSSIFLIAFSKIRNVDSCAVNNTKFFMFLRYIIQRKNIMKVYYISYLLEFFYALMIIYTPLYLLDLGFGWLTIGQIFTVMLIPFVLLQYPAGYLADTRFEERDMLAIALFIMGVSTCAIYFIGLGSAFVWAAVLFCTRIGASLIEVLRDSYFYKRIDQRDVDVADFFRTVRPIAYITGSLVATPIIFFFQIKFIFVLIGIVVLTGIPVSLRLASSRIPPVLPKQVK